jgi:hypothetical protein
MRKKIEDYVKKREKCQTNKALRPKKKAPMEITTTDRHPFERCALDIVGPLTETSGSKYILAFHDDLSKFLLAMPVSQPDAETIASVVQAPGSLKILSVLYFFFERTAGKTRADVGHIHDE